MTIDNNEYTEAIEVARKTGIPVDSNETLTTVLSLAKSFSDEKQSQIRLNEEREVSKIRMDERKANNRLNKEVIGSVTLSLAILGALALGGSMLALGSEADKERGKTVVSVALISALTAYGARG